MIGFTRDYDFKKFKRGIIYLDLTIPIFLALTVYAPFYLGLVTWPGLSCETPPALRIIEFFEDTKKLYACHFNVFAKIFTYILFPYMFFCACLVASPLKASPAMYFKGGFLTNQKTNEKASLPEALSLLFFGPELISVYFIALYFLHFDFNLTFHQIININFIFAALGLIVKAVNLYQNSDLLLEEKISGLKLHLTPKAQEEFEGISASRAKSRFQFFNYIEMYGDYIGAGLMILIYGFFAFNALREGAPPTGYDELVYKRPPVEWQDNAYFALAGLNAPLDVENFYEYGRQKTAFHSRQLNDLKKELEIPFIQPVPQIPGHLYSEDDLADRPEFNKTDIPDWDCIYNLNARNNSPTCPAYQDIITIINGNEPLWTRFQSLSGDADFSIPDFFEPQHNMPLLLDLGRLQAAYTILLQSRGDREGAIEAWQNYTRLYLNMARASSSNSNRHFFLNLIRIQIYALETLLFHDPSMARDFGDIIERTLYIKNIDDFRASTLLVDEWRTIEPLILAMVGSSPFQKQKMYACFLENQKLADLTAMQFFSEPDNGLCDRQYTEDLKKSLLKSFADPGNFITNIIIDLLAGPSPQRSKELIAGMHDLLSNIQMAHTALYLLKENIPSERVDEALRTLPDDLQNPITNSPFLWDRNKQQLYFKDASHAAPDPIHIFHVNIKN